MSALSVMDMNKPGMSILGDRAAVAGVFDLNGLIALEKKIAGLKALLDRAPDFSDLLGEDETPN